MVSQQGIEKTSGLLLVLILHAVLLYAAWSYKLVPPANEAMTLMVNFINPPPPKKEEPPKPLPKKVILDKPKMVEKPRPLPMLVAETPVVSEVEYTAPIPEPMPLQEAPKADSPAIEAAPAMHSSKPAMPIMMSTELSLACPHRTPPSYPTASRRMGEHGRVVLRVELDDAGQIIGVKVKESSGYKRLDEAGVAVVKTWQCDAAMQDGKAVPAVALQPFDFILN